MSGPATVESFSTAPDELPTGTEALARAVTLFGTSDHSPELIATWTAAGADSVQLVPPPGRPEDELAEIVSPPAASGHVTTLR